MKQKASLLFTLFLLLSAGYANAQSTGDGRYTFVISKINYLKAVNDAIENSQAAGIQVLEVRVILCGESVKALTENNPLVAKSLQINSITLYACGLSLEQMNVDPKLLPKEVSTVKNGLLEAMKLEKVGHKVFDL